MPADLKERFHQEMINLYTRTRDEVNYNATYFLRMLSDKGGVETARYLIRSKDMPSGFTKLCEANRLDLSIEAFIFDNEEYHPLFSDEELEIILERLRQYEYGPATQQQS